MLMAEVLLPTRPAPPVKVRGEVWLPSTTALPVGRGPKAVLAKVDGEDMANAVVGWAGDEVAYAGFGAGVPAARMTLDVFPAPVWVMSWTCGTV